MLWGLSPEERLRRSFRRHGIGQQAGGDAAAVVIAHADYLIEDRVAAAIAKAEGTVVALNGGAPFAAHVPAEAADAAARLIEAGAPVTAADLPPGVGLLDLSDLVPDFNYELRKRETPLVVPLSRASLPEIEWRTFMAAYKGVTDIVTKHVWPVPAFWVTRWAARNRITPNMVTTAGLALVFVAFNEFAAGRFWTGLVAAWLMTFFDTVDGKLARVTLTASNWGKHYDHAIDIIHPPLWWGAWWYGLRQIADPAAVPMLDLCGVVVVGGYVAERLVEEAFKRIYKVRIHVWERLDSVFRLITARRNPNLAILTVGMIVGAPAAGFAAVAAWTAISVVFHFARFLQAGGRRVRGQKILSWLEHPG